MVVAVVVVAPHVIGIGRELKDVTVAESGDRVVDWDNAGRIDRRGSSVDFSIFRGRPRFLLSVL